MSLRTFDAGHTHKGYIGEIDYTTGRIGVKHARGCCEDGLISGDCEPTLWQHIIHSKTEMGSVQDEVERPTAWDRLLRD